MTVHAFDRRRRFIATVACSALLAGGISPAVRPAAAQQRDCNRPLRDPVMVFDVPGVEATPTRDGCWIFAAYSGDPVRPTGSGIVALQRVEAGFEERRVIPLALPRAGGPNGFAYVGLAVTSDGKLLVVSHNDRISFFDVARMTSGSENPLLGELESPRLAMSWGVVISSDDKYAFASQRTTSSVVIVDLDRIRQGVFDQSALTGVIPTAQGGTMSVLSPDGRYLFATTMRAPDVVDAPLICQGGKVADGSIQVADVRRARTQPELATIAFAFPAGCNPMWAALSPDGNRLSAAAAGSSSSGPVFSAADSSVTVFDARPVREGKPPTLVGKVPVSAGPTRLVDTGDRLVVAFAPQGNPASPSPATPSVMVLDPAKAALGVAAVMGTLPFPMRSLAMLPDGRTLIGGYGTKLAAIDLARVKLDPVN